MRTLSAHAITSNVQHQADFKPRSLAERRTQREVNDWLTEQECAEVDALITHMSLQRERSMKLEAYG